MTLLERIDGAPLFTPLDDGEPAMVLGARPEPKSHDFIQNADGTMTYIGEDYVADPARPA